MTIGDGYDNEAVLIRSGAHWIIPELHGLPADASKINALLPRLVRQSAGWPVGNSKPAQQRFQVSKTNYQRRLKLGAISADIATIYLGTSPGFGKVHARNADDDAIFPVELNNFDLPAVASKWLDPRLLQVRVPIRIDTDLYHLRLEDGAWLTGNGRLPGEATLLTLLTALKTLEVVGLADEDQARHLAALEADTIMVIESLAGTVTFEFKSWAEQYFVFSDEYPLLFQIGQQDYARLTDIDLGLITSE